MTWTEQVLLHASGLGDRAAVRDVRSGTVLTYARFAHRVTHAAAGLRGRGLRPGDPLVFDLPPGCALPLAVHAAAWAGALVLLGGSGGRPHRLAISHGRRAMTDTGAQEVFTFDQTPGTTPFADLTGHGEVEFGPIAGPALAYPGEPLRSLADMAAERRRVAARGLFGMDDVVLAAITDTRRLLALLDVAFMAGARVVIAHEPTLVGCRVLAAEYEATVVVAPRELGRRLSRGIAPRVLDDTLGGGL